MENSAEYLEGYNAAKENDKMMRRQQQRNSQEPWDSFLIQAPYPEGSQFEDWAKGYGASMKEMYPELNKYVNGNKV